MLAPRGETPRQPIPAAAKSSHEQLVASVTLLRPFVVRDLLLENRERFTEVQDKAGHAPTPLALNCIRLI